MKLFRRAVVRGAREPGGRLICRAAGALALGLLLGILAGCAGSKQVHPALRPEGEDLERAVKRGERMAKSGADPYTAIAQRPVEANQRLSSGVVLWSASICWPAQQMAFQIAQSGATNDAEVRRAERDALKLIERELRFTATVQMPASRDPADIQFALQSSTGVEYPPVAVETPIPVRDVASVWGSDAGASRLYMYVVRFPIRDGCGTDDLGEIDQDHFVGRANGEKAALAIEKVPEPLGAIAMSFIQAEKDLPLDPAAIGQPEKDIPLMHRDPLITHGRHLLSAAE